MDRPRAVAEDRTASLEAASANGVSYPVCICPLRTVFSPGAAVTVAAMRGQVMMRIVGRLGRWLDFCEPATGE